MACHVRDDGLLAPRRQEDHDVASHDGNVEQAVQVNGREISETPVYKRRLLFRRSEHRWVEVDANNVSSATSELTPHPARSATGIEHGRRRESLDEVGFTVDIFAGSGAGIVGRVVNVAGGAPVL